MFAKPYKHKSNNTLKNSEKKHLAQRIRDEFPLASEEKVKELVPVKSSCICMKLVVHSGDTVNVYAVDGLPMFIETAERLVPTVCALWKAPDLVPTLNIHTPVLSKLLNGAPLYLPGVVVPAAGAGFPVFGRGAVLAACTTDNGAACAVGRAAMSSGDMLLKPSGVCLEPVHVFGDQLCKDERFGRIERPRLSLPSTDAALTLQLTQMSLQPAPEEWPALGGAPHTAPPLPPPREQPPLIVEDTPPPDHTTPDEENNDTETEDALPTDMDGWLRWSLLCYLKLEGKGITLPLKANLLYKSLQLLCSEEVSLDVKKSSYKKFTKFLEAMQTEGLLESSEIERGVAALTAVNLAHPLVRGQVVPAALRERGTPGDEPGYAPPAVREMFCVTAAVVELFAPHKKGTALSPGEVRTLLTEYVKRRQLTGAAKGAVTLDDTLAAVVGMAPQEIIKWDALMSKVQSRMTAATELVFPGGDVTLTKSRLAPVTMHIQQRSGNKKVTVVSNLQSFGFSLNALAAESQRGAAVSATVTRLPGAAADQLMLQGDQSHFIAKLLVEKYGLPKKFLEGADKALKKKNK